MNKEEVQHLAKLARIELSDSETEAFTSQISSIIDYVGQVKGIVSQNEGVAKKAGVVRNVLRKDEIKNEPDQFTKDILREMPHTDGRYMEVKKILNTES